MQIDKERTLEDYRIPGTNLLNFSAYSRENIPKPPPKHKVGDVVKYTGLFEVTEVYQDCDGTPLYALDKKLFGINDENLETPSKAELEDW